jgi:tetratricopeptide (TPR) repeat protein
VALVTWLAITASAAAQVADDERARRHFASGESYYAEGDYESALHEFEQALRLSQRPALHYNLYLVKERLGRLAEAADHLERYLADAPVAGSDRELLTRRLENLRRRTEDADDDATDETDGDTAEEPPEASPTPTEETVDPEAGVARPAESGGGGIGVGPIVAYSVGGAGLVTFGLFAALALAENGSVASSCGADTTATCSDEELSTLRTFALVADIGLGVALAGAAVGTVLLLVGGGGGDEERESVAAAPWVAPGSAGAVVRGSF